MTVTKKTLVAAATALVLAGSASAALANAEMSANATVYSDATTSSTVLGEIASGTDVAIKSCFGNWCKITFDGGTGYTYQSLVDLDGYLASPGTSTN